MKKSSLLVSAAVFALGVSGALAADLPSRKAAPILPPPPPPPPMWTGFYAGLNLGGGWSANSVNPNQLTPYVSTADGQLFLLPGNTNGGNNAGGVVGGGQVGYNYQIGPSFLVGLETDIQGTSMKSGGNTNYILSPDPNFAGAYLYPLTPGGNPGVAVN